MHEHVAAGDERAEFKVTTARARSTGRARDRAAVAEMVVRTGLRLRLEQQPRAALAILASLTLIGFTLYGRVATERILLWVLFVGGGAIARLLQSLTIHKRLETSSIEQLRRDDLAYALGLLAHSAGMGSGYWLLAAVGDTTVDINVTFASILFTVPTIVGAATRYRMVALSGVANLGQGALFWLGIGASHEPEFAIGAMLITSLLLFIPMTRVYADQFADSVRIRAENIELLGRLEAENSVAERALSEAREASASKSRFLAAASHDLRQPLHALSMFLGTLSFHIETDEARRLLNRIKETTRVMEEQFNSLLDMSRFDAGAVAPDIRPFRLDHCIDRLIEELRPTAEEKNLRLNAALRGAIAKSDVNLVGRLLRNLLDNAIKYTQSGSISVQIAEQPGGFTVEVVDTGPGIPVEQQSRIFDEYVQLSNPARQRQHGVGLGLAIVKRIDLLLGLGLTLRSTIGVGSTFSFLVPAATSEDAPLVGVAAFGTMQFKTAKSIWILDDDPIALESLANQLQAWGAAVESFSSPEQLLVKYRERESKPEWVFTDDMLGTKLSGLDVANLLAGESGSTQVCVITGNTQPARIAELRASNFPVLVKPAKPEQLVELIGN